MPKKKKQKGDSNDPQRVPIKGLLYGYVDVSLWKIGIKFPNFPIDERLIDGQSMYKMIDKFGFDFSQGGLEFRSVVGEKDEKLVVISPSGDEDFQFEIKVNWMRLRDAYYFFIG